MLVPLVQMEVIGLTTRLDDALLVLQRLQCAQVVATAASPAAPAAGRSTAAGDERRRERVTRLLSLAPDRAGARERPPSDDALDDLLDRVYPRVHDLLERMAAFDAEADDLARRVEALDALQPLIPELSTLNDGQLARLGLASIALVLEDPRAAVITAFGTELDDLLGPGHLLVTSPPNDDGHLGALLVLRQRRLPEVHALLGIERIGRAGIPEEYTGQSLRSTVASMQKRLERLPEERARVEEEVAELVSQVAPTLAAADRGLRARAERASAAREATRTEATFALRVWLPVDRCDLVRPALAAVLGPEVVVHTVDVPNEQSPVLLRNRPRAVAFQNLVGLLSWPAARTVDPTGMMAITLPLFFGVMVGDVGYAVCMIIGAWFLRRLSRGSLARQAAHVLTLGGSWAVVFGLLFGELFGSFGHHLGMPALWFYRGGPAALQPLLLFSVAIGLVHVIVGLGVGVWVAARLRRKGQLAERAGNLLVLVGLFVIAGAAAGGMPPGVLTPAVGLVIVGVVLVTVSQGAIGLLLGPLSVLGVIGNVLSYLRLAAVGLASVYLAGVANTLAGEGPLLLGIIVATFFHALNLALAAFSPMIQSLRLHYVEFFGQFHEGDGRLFSPLGVGLVDPYELLNDGPATPSARSQTAPQRRTTRHPEPDRVGVTT
jgi:V/A-type H+/Na+-transporting ATPase subunit I